ncbi:MAG TPA: serine hydrolase domain-containing protein [Vicinamibacterales bacterium]|nr:serine hydrolase domain-containing protein [Vicinamibacterales bacterium]
MRRFYCFLVFLVVGLVCHATAAGGALDLKAARDAAIAKIEGPQVPNRQGYDGLTLEQMMQRFRVPGASVAVIRDFEIDWTKGYGVADVSTGTRVTPETLFQAASISKPVTAVAAAILHQRGTIDLDADVNTYLKSWKVPVNEFTRQRPVTLRALLSHTSGTGDGFGFPGYPPGAPRPTLTEILGGKPPSNVGTVAWERPPFTAQKYSGGGTVIVQLALSEATGKAFPDLMRELVLGPAGMKNSAFEQPLSEERDRNAARAHSGRGAAMGPKWHVYPELAAAGLWTTPADLATLGIEIQKALLGRSSVLSRAAALELVSPVGTGQFAVGFAVERRGEGWYFMHGGSNWGFQCNLVLHRLKGYGFAIMTNSDSGGALIRELEARIAAAYNWDSLDKPVPR